MKGGFYALTCTLPCNILSAVVLLLVYLWVSQRNLIINSELTPKEYLWKLKQITDISEYELFHYVKKFLDDGKEYIIKVLFFRYLILQQKYVRYYSVSQLVP